MEFIEPEELKFDKERFALLSKQEQLKFIERKISFVLREIQKEDSTQR